MRVRASAPPLACVTFAGLLAATACSTRRRADARPGPFLSIARSDAALAARSAVTPSAVTLALGGLPPEELPHLRRQLAESTDGALRRAAPELFDLDDVPAADAGADPLREVLPDLPALTAGANLLGAPWGAPGLAVTVVASCDARASRCVPLFVPASPAEDSATRRGRALAWALGHAAILRVDARDAALGALREAQMQPQGTIAMVFASARGTLDVAELERLRREARRALAQVRPDAPQRPWLEALTAAPSDWALPVDVGADEILVVPRLRALARLGDFVSEITGAAGPHLRGVGRGGPAP